MPTDELALVGVGFLRYGVIDDQSAASLENVRIAPEARPLYPTWSADGHERGGLMEDTQQYRAGQTIRATLSFLGGDRVRRVIATFVHEDDPGERIVLSGTPYEKAATEGIGYSYWKVNLSETITAENELGAYRCEAVEAEYPGGSKVALAGVPDAGFRLVEEDIQPPEVIEGWEWGTSR